MKIKKFQNGSPLYPGLSNLSMKWEDMITQKMLPVPKLNYPSISTKPNNLNNQVTSTGINAVSNYLSNTVTNKIFDDSELGRSLGTLFSSELSSSLNSIGNNLLKGNSLLKGINLNIGVSLAGAGAGIVSNYIGKGITSLGGNSMLSKGIGSGVAAGLGTVGGNTLSNLISKTTSSLNPYGLAMTIAGSALGSALGPSKEYSGKYGNITQTMDTVYDTAMMGVNFIPGAGLVISGAMALNKGLSNVFGSTDGMTKLDAILGSAFMPAPVKWVNMWGSSKTGTFNNLSWQNSEKTNSFMGDAFGNLGDKFDLARKEAGKRYGTFSQGAKRRALRNINFANEAWDKILSLADLNEYQNIRSEYMSSINNQKYAQDIQGGWSPLARGKHGMKIFNNATNHNIGMRLLSGAALIDNKQMILCNVVD